MNQMLAWRSMHSQGRGLNSVMMNQLARTSTPTRCARRSSACNAIVGFNFGDGHLHDQPLINAIQKRCQFAPGEFIVVWVESEPVFNGRQQYWVMDAAVGVVERGSWSVKDASGDQLAAGRPDRDAGRLRLAGYQRVSYALLVGAAPAAGQDRR